jgi:hypothetical protein
MLKDNQYHNEEQLISEVLKMDPGYELSEDFSEKLAQKFERQFALNTFFKEFLIYFGVGTGIIATAIAMVFFLMSDIWVKWANIITANSEVLIGIAFLLSFILFADQVLLRYFSYKLKRKTIN